MAIYSLTKKIAACQILQVIKKHGIDWNIKMKNNILLLISFVLVHNIKYLISYFDSNT